LFSNDYFLVHHPVNWDDWHLLAHAMASDFTVTWQHSQREQYCSKNDLFAEQSLTLSAVQPSRWMVPEVAAFLITIRSCLKLCQPETRKYSSDLDSRHVSSRRLSSVTRSVW
jgi:hypothetical protein